MDVVGVMAAYLTVVCVCVCVCTVQSREALNGHDRTITVILPKHCIKFPDDGSLVIRKMLEHFEIFLNIL